MNSIELLKNLFVRFGASWVLVLLGILSIISLFFILERYLYLRTKKANYRALAESLHQSLSQRDFEGAIQIMNQSKSTAAAIAVSGLRLAERGVVSAEKGMQSAMALERERLERFLAFLGTLGNNAPFVGLLGTVIGIIGAFEELGHAAPGHGSAAAQATQIASQAVMSNIAEALVTTAVGIIVALPAVAAYNYFQRKIAELLSSTDILTNIVLAYIADVNPAQSDDSKN